MGPTRSGVKCTKLQANSFHCITGIVLRRSRQSQRRRGSSVSGQASGREKVDDIYIIVVPRDVEYLYEK